jgi:hypothetical protein
MVDLLPLALVITVSPPSITPAVLVLHAPRPRPSSLAYFAGWILGLSVLTAISIGISSMLGGLRNSPPHWAFWLRTLTNVTPARAGITAAALTVLNPKVLFVCAAAGLAIGTDVLASPEP